MLMVNFGSGTGKPAKTLEQ